MSSPSQSQRTLPGSIPSSESLTDEEFDDLPLSVTLQMKWRDTSEPAPPLPSPPEAKKSSKKAVSNMITEVAHSHAQNYYTTTSSSPSAPFRFMYLSQHDYSEAFSNSGAKELQHPERETSASPSRTQLPSISSIYGSPDAQTRVPRWSIEDYEKRVRGYSSTNPSPTISEEHCDAVADFELKLAEYDNADTTSSMSREQLRRHKNRLSAARSRRRYQAKMDYLENLVKKLIHQNDELHQTVQNLSIRLQTYQRIVGNAQQHFTQENASARHLREYSRKYSSYAHGRRRTFELS